MQRIIAFFVALVLSTSFVLAQQVLGGQNLPSKAPAQSIGNEANWYLDFNSGNIWGPKTSGSWGSSAAGNIIGAGVSGFAGLQFGVAPGDISTPTGTMTNYAAGDTITLQCPGVTFTFSPVVGVTAVTTGSVTAASIVDPGVTTGAIPSGTNTCTQASTSGTGTGFQIQVKFGLIASYLSIPGLLTGGGSSNRNLLLNLGSNREVSNRFGGAENTMVGDGAGAGSAGNDSNNTLIGATVACCGTNALLQNVTAVGVDALRNSNGNFGGSFVGVGSGKVGGNFDTMFGYNTGPQVTGAGDLILGPNVASTTLTTGTSDVIIGNSANCDASAAGASDEVTICTSSTALIRISGGATPGTAITKISGAIANIGTAPTLPTGTCSGSSWTGGAVVGKFTAAVCAAGTFILSNLPAAPNGYVCVAQDQTTPADTLKQTANTTTSCTLTSTTVAFDVIVVQALAY